MIKGNKLACLAGMVAILGMSLTLAQAVESDTYNATQSLIKMKSGACSFKVMGPDGVKPLSDIEISLTAGDDAAKSVAAVTDQQGACSLATEDGRYVVALNGRDVAVLETTPENELSEYKFVFTASPDLLVGGQDDGEEDDDNDAAIILLIVGAAIGAGFIIENNVDDDSSGRRGVDVNGDGVVNALDDVNGDGVINQADVDQFNAPARRGSGRRSTGGGGGGGGTGASS